MLADIGLSVMREIPLQTMAGLLNGAYTLHGGVVRDAGGRIVAHLLTSGPLDLVKTLVPGVNVLTSLIGSGQVYTLARDVEQVRSLATTVLQVSVAGTALTGLGLVASIGGTIYLSRKLDKVQGQLVHIERLINDQHLSVLRGAIDNLRHAEHASDAATRKAMLVSAKTDFSRSTHFYGSQFADPRSSEEVLALEDSFVLAAMGSAICLSELGMSGAAAAEFDSSHDRWKGLARKHVGGVLGDSPDRLMSKSHVDELPASELVAALDFVHESNKSWAWIDELRRGKGTRTSISLPWGENDKASKAGFLILKTLPAKARAISAIAEHLRFLDGKRLSLGSFYAAADTERQKLNADAVCVVAEPASN